MLKGNQKVPARLYVSNIPFIIIKRKKTIYLESTLAKQIVRSSTDCNIQTNTTLDWIITYFFYWVDINIWMMGDGVYKCSRFTKQWWSPFNQKLRNSNIIILLTHEYLFPLSMIDRLHYLLSKTFLWYVSYLQELGARGQECNFK